MENPVDVEKAPEVAAEKPKDDSGSRVPRFPVGGLVPLNGIWFKISEVKAEGLFLVPVGFTKKGRKP